MPTPKPPFPYFGGKSGIAPQIWERLGKVDNYVEPFCGSAAILLADPYGIPTRTINDMDGFIVNFWRATSVAPDEVAGYSDWPISETDLFSRHIWLINQKQDMLKKLIADPDWFDSKVAGWWCWGLCCWIGSGWCSGTGSWTVRDGEVVKTTGDGANSQIPFLSGDGQGVNRKIPNLGDNGTGVNRQIPELATNGRGVLRPIEDLVRGGEADAYSAHLVAYMRQLRDTLRRVRVTCGDWSRVLTPSVTVRHGMTGVVLDPPYGEGNVDYSNGGNLDKNIAKNVWDWAVENGGDPSFRIIVCAYDDGRRVPNDWTIVKWKARKGYQTAENDRSDEEILYLSPNCIKIDAEKQLSLF